ncbi:MAG: hypothetical protein WC966_10775 [Bradymonadales bacterium]|jgi:hypothetical protein
MIKQPVILIFCLFSFFLLFACQAPKTAAIEDTAIALEEPESAIVEAAAADAPKDESSPCAKQSKAVDGVNCRCEDGQWKCDKAEFTRCGIGRCGHGGSCVNGRCLCATAPAPLNIEAYQCDDGRWLCQEGECACGTGKCGFLGACESGQCFCGKSPKPDKVENYACFEQKEWVCNLEEGCACGAFICGKGGSCKDGKCSCGEAKAPLNINRYFCAVTSTGQKEWICKNEDGCACGGGICGKYGACVDEQCTCGKSPMPAKHAGYECLESERALALQACGDDTCRNAWLCTKPEGCACGASQCGYGNICHEGRCICSQEELCDPYACNLYKKDATAGDLCKAPCKTPLAKTASFECQSIESSVCKDEAGCRCGDSFCALNSVCAQGKCLCGDAPPIEDGRGYVCDGGRWQCKRPEGCSCGGQNCGLDSFCQNGSCLCGTAKSPSQDLSRYRCHEERQWVCNDPQGCACGKGRCGLNSVCAKGQCLCGPARAPKKDAALYRCDGDLRWSCSRDSGCSCGRGLCGYRGECRNGECFCSSSRAPMADAGQYQCEQRDPEESEKSWVCYNWDGCACGTKQCAYNVVCHHGQCTCGENIAAPEDASQYSCENRRGWVCTREDGCSCGSQGCGYNGICQNGECTCAGIKAPADAKNYLCDPEKGWICEKDEGCVCGEQTCPYFAVCQDANCVCGNSLAPEKPKNYLCDDEGQWFCNSVNGCDCGDEKCANGAICDKGKCRCGLSEKPRFPSEYQCAFKDEVYAKFACGKHDCGMAWVCAKAGGCSCGNESCGFGNACVDGKCICTKGGVCGRESCQTLRMQKNCQVGGCFNIKNAQSYSCENEEKQTCLFKSGCACGSSVCGYRGVCAQGKCLCGEALAPEKAQQFECVEGTWLPIE